MDSVSIKENKEKENDDIKTYSFETIFTNRDGYTFKLIAPKVRFKEYSMTGYFMIQNMHMVVIAPINISFFTYRYEY